MKKILLLKAFTLVELIVVITILAILGSIAFLSMNGYASKARDSNRLSDLKVISDGLSVFYTKTGNYPLPEKYVTISGSGATLRYQGIAGMDVLSFISLSNINQGSGRDPKTGEFYNFVLDGYKVQFQLSGNFENLGGLAFKMPLYKTNAETPIIKYFGSDLGTMYENENPVNKIGAYVGNSIDIRNTNNIYKINYTSSDSITGTGAKLFASMYNRDKNLLNDKTLAYLDDSLVGFWDMETFTNSGNQVVLKDLSKFGSNGVCYDNSGSNVINCGEGTGPKKESDSMSFDGNDFVQIDRNVYTDEMTMIARVRPRVLDSTWHGFVGYQSFGSGNIRPFNLWVTPDWNHPNGGFHRDNNAIDATDLNELGKRCAGDNEYVYDPNEQQKRDFFVAYRRTPPNVDLTINGKKIMQATCPFSVFYKAPAFWIGRIDNFFVGNIYEVRIYNRALSDSEISAIYESNVN